MLEKELKMLKIVNGLFSTDKIATIDDIRSNFIKVKFVDEVIIDGKNTIVFCALIDDDFDNASGSFEVSKGLVTYQVQKPLFVGTTRTGQKRIMARSGSQSEDAKAKRLKKMIRRENNPVMTIRNWKQFTGGKRSILNRLFPLGVV